MDWIYRYFKLWSIFIPITSVVLIPSVKGTLPSYIMAFLSPICFFLSLRINTIFSYLRFLFKGLFIFAFLILISQLGNLILPININTYSVLNDASDTNSIFFRSSLITQSLYLLPCFLLYTYTRFFYEKRWDKWINYSTLLFAIIGLAKWIIFFVTNGATDGDFLTNRTYGQDGGNTLFQNIYIAGFHFARLQSLTGEPSNYALIMVPLFFFLLSSTRKKLPIIIVFISLFLTASSTVFVGLLVGAGYYLWSNRSTLNITLSKIIVVILFVVAIIMFYLSNQDLLDAYLDFLIFNKTSSGSADERFGFMGNNLTLWMSSDLWHQLFGIGFGVVRSTDLFSTFLVDIGLVGLIAASIFWFYDFRLHPRNKTLIYQNMVILSSFIMAMLSVPEFSFLSLWLLLGVFRSRSINKIDNDNEVETLK